MLTDKARCFSSFATMIVFVFVAQAVGQVEAPRHVLFFGNSFTIGYGSAEAQEVGGVPGMVRALAAAAGHAAPHIENAAAGGRSLSWHLANSMGSVTDPQDFDAAAGFQWDAVVMQGYSTRPTHLGDLAQFRADVAAVFAQVRGHSPAVRGVLFETWARGPGHAMYTGDPPDFPGGPAQMQQEVRAGYALAEADLIAAFGAGSAMVAPVGSTWEQTGWDELYAADIYHANARGTYLTALVIFGTLYGEPTRGLPPVLASLDAAEAAALQAQADAMLADTRGFGRAECNANGMPDAPNVLIDFGDAAAQTLGRSRYWNNVYYDNMTTPLALRDAAGLPSGMTLTITPGLTFNGFNTSGTTSPAAGSALARRAYPVTATQDSLFGNDVVFGAGTYPRVELTLAGLTPGRTYALRMCASRLGVSDVRAADYAVQGLGGQTVTLDASNNAAEVAVAAVAADAGGTLVITIDKGAGNSNDYGFYYLGVLEISAAR